MRISSMGGNWLICNTEELWVETALRVRENTHTCQPDKKQASCQRCPQSKHPPLAGHLIRVHNQAHPLLHLTLSCINSFLLILKILCMQLTSSFLACPHFHRSQNPFLCVLSHLSPRLIPHLVLIIQLYCFSSHISPVHCVLWHLCQHIQTLPIKNWPLYFQTCLPTFQKPQKPF